MATEKEEAVLLKIYELSMKIKGSPYNSIHYLSLIDTIFSEEVRKKYRQLKVQRMACSYLGRMARKDLIQTEYNTVNNYSYFVGYYLRHEGIEIINSLINVK